MEKFFLREFSARFNSERKEIKCLFSTNHPLGDFSEVCLSVFEVEGGVRSSESL